MVTENKNQKTNHIMNHLFAEEYKYDGKFEVETHILLVQYNAEDLQYRKLETDAGITSFKEVCRDDCINWFDITGLTNTVLIQQLLSDFGFFPVDAKPVLTPCHAAKIDEYADRLIIVIRPCFFDKKGEITSEHICMLVKDNVVLTFREVGVISFDNAMKALRVNMMNIRQETKGLLIAFVLNAILSVMIGTAIKVEEMLENMDRILLEAEVMDRHIGRKIQHCSNANLFLQKNTVPLKDEFDKLLQIRLIHESKIMMPVYMELYNQLDYILLTSQNSKDLLSSLRDLYVTNNDLKTNTIMKRLTIVATFFIPITFLAGLWGMNFEMMPEVKWEYGYFFAWGMFAITGFLTWLYMKRNKWF